MNSQFSIPTDYTTHDMNESETLEFIPFKKTHLQDVVDLHKELFPVEYTEDFFQRLLSDEFWTIVALSRKRVVGIATGRYAIETEWDQIKKSLGLSLSHGYISTIGVTAEYRRKGLGSYLLQEICRMLSEEAGCTRISLHVKFGNNAAIRFYQKHGFHTRKQLHNYYLIHERFYDAILMTITIEELLLKDKKRNISDDSKTTFIINKKLKRKKRRGFMDRLCCCCKLCEDVQTKRWLSRWCWWPARILIFIRDKALSACNNNNVLEV